MTWDYGKTEYQTQTKSDPVWHLERLINYGVGKETIDREILKENLEKLKISDDRRAFLELLVWNKQF